MLNMHLQLLRADCAELLEATDISHCTKSLTTWEARGSQRFSVMGVMASTDPAGTRISKASNARTTSLLKSVLGATMKAVIF